MEALQGEVDALHGQMEILVSDRDAATNESESLRAQLLDLQDQNVAAQNQIQMLQEDVGRLSAEKNDSVSALNMQLAQLQAENASLQNQMANASEAPADTGELEALRNELQNLRESSEAEMNQLRARVEKSIRQRDEVKMAFEEVAQQNEMLHKQLASAQAGGASSACADFVRKWTPRFVSIIEFAQEMTNSIDATQGLDPSVSENAHEMLNVLVKVNQKMNKANETLG
jgi:chromosome segregation ATPase